MQQKGGADNVRHLVGMETTTMMCGICGSRGGGTVARVLLEEESSSSEEEFVRPAPAMAAISISEASPRHLRYPLIDNI